MPQSEPSILITGEHFPIVVFEVVNGERRTCCNTLQHRNTSQDIIRYCFHQ